MARPRVTAGFRCEPERQATDAPTNTAKPHPKLISSQPPPVPFDLASTTVATTPQPSRINVAVPMTSQRKISPRVGGGIRASCRREHRHRCRCENKDGETAQPWKIYA